MTTGRLALRNVLRQRRRSLITVLAVTLSFAMFLVLTGIGDGAHRQIVEIGVRMGLGDVVIEADGYRHDPSLDHLVHDAAAVRGVALGMGDAVEGVALRLQTDGMVQAGPSSLGAAVWGVDPASEGRLSKIGAPDSIVEGAALSAADAAPPSGTPPPIVIGREMAHQLGAHLGDRLSVTLAPAGGGPLESAAFVLKGVYATGVRDVDGHVALVPLAVAQRLAHAPDSATMVAVLLRSLDDAPRFAAALRGRLRGRALETLSWQEAAPELYATIAIDQGGLYLMMVVVYIVVAAGILNTILISVLERTRELGVLLALGTPPGRLMRLVLAEAAILAALSLALGLALGLGVEHHLATAGLELQVGHMEASGVLLPSHFYATLSPMAVLTNSGVVFALVMLSALYPALRAARLQPVEAIHHV